MYILWYNQLKSYCTYFVLQSYPVWPLIKGFRVVRNLTFKQQQIINQSVVADTWEDQRGSMLLSEIGEKEEKVDGQPEEVENVEIGEISNLLRSISISGDISEGLDQTGEGDNMDKQRIDAIRVELSTIADDIEDFIDENEIDENSTTSEVDCKISKIEDLRTS